MFIAIHKAIKFLLLCGWILVGWKIYDHREMFEPAAIWYDVWENGGFDVPKVEVVSGPVLRVINSQTFVFEPVKGSKLNCRLMGLREPLTEASIIKEDKEIVRRSALENLILNKTVDVKLLYQNANNIGGLIFVDGTNNVNATLILQGYAVGVKEKLQGMPKEDQYRMLWAMRHRTRIF